MPKKKTGARQSGNPAQRAPLGQFLTDNVQPTGNADPRTIGFSGLSGPGGSRDPGATILDPADVILVNSCEVAVIDGIRNNQVVNNRSIYLNLGGRINKTDRTVQLGFLLGLDGAAALMTELLALADRAGAELVTDIVDRFVSLAQAGDADLHFIRAALDNAIEEAERNRPPTR